MNKSPSGTSSASLQTSAPPANSYTTTQSTARAPTFGGLNTLRGPLKSPVYAPISYNHSVSPITAPGSFQESHNSGASSSVVSPTHVSSANLNAQKRAYRQRRKDPSCDACRERKVKCDATETSACSECSSRNHKCQFTKETNRRMSSIKQVQDLQTQIAELTQLNTQLRTKIPDGDSIDGERLDMKRRHSDAHIRPEGEPQRVPAPVMNDFDRVRDNIRAHAHGLFNVPHRIRNDSPESHSRLSKLPPQAVFAALSQRYKDSMYEWYPALHWPTFQRKVDQVYTSRNSQGIAREWLGLLFAVLACGSLQRRTIVDASSADEVPGTAYCDLASEALSLWPHTPSITYVQAALLLSIFTTEINERSLGSMWLASAVRAAQELNLHAQIDSCSAMETEVRRRLWWSIYVRDRITSLDAGKPMLINENDCEVSYPSSATEDGIPWSGGLYSMPARAVSSTRFIDIVQVTRLYSQISYALKTSIILPQTLHHFDELFRSKWLHLPGSHHIESDIHLETSALPTVFSILSAKFHLARRNMTPLCRTSERIEALDRCVSIGMDTAKFISRTLDHHSESQAGQSWQERVCLIASNSICLHLWRCIMVLCFRNEYEAGLMCLRISTAIGGMREINISCGRNLAFVLDEILHRARAARGMTQELVRDEELMAYVSGDAQGSVEHAWVWAGANSNSKDLRPCSVGEGAQSPVDEPMQDVSGHRSPSPRTDKPELNWDGWRGLEDRIHQLMEMERARSTQPLTYYPPPHNPVKRVQLTTGDRASTTTVSPTNHSMSNTSRISIANII